MKKFFEEPKMDILNLAVEDIMSESWVPGENEGEGDLL